MRIYKNSLINLIQYLFIIVSSAELFMGILRMCNYELPHKRTILWFFFFVYFICMLANKYSKKELLIFAFTFIAGVCLYINTGINTGIKAPVYIMALKGIDKRKLLQCFLCTCVSACVIIVIGALFFGIGDVYFWEVKKDNRIDKACFCFGFSNPNRLQLLLYGILTYFLMLYGRKGNRCIISAAMLAYFAMAYLTKCNTGMLLGIFAILAVILVRKINDPKFLNYIMIFFTTVLAAMILISFWAAVNGNKGKVLNLINDVISGRINQLGEYSNEEFYNLPYINNWALFSDRNNKNGCDMGYIYIFYYYGIVISLIYISFIINAVNRARKRNDSLGMVLITGLSMYLFMETGYYSNYLTLDFLLMTSAIVFYSDYDKNITPVS